MNPIVECVPNFSEGRNLEIIQDIYEQINTVPGVSILDRHSDIDHNRTVITFVGSPDSVEEAAFKAIEKASQLIDLNRHQGEHPRIGAADVVPFIPIKDIDIETCIQIARRLGKRVGEELHLPVYLYEEAALHPERRNLEYIRHGEYEGLIKEIASNPKRKPDFGPSKISSAGATVIGARLPLIAYNVFLTTSDTAIAQRIASAVRNSSGGFRFVKALGLHVDSLAQVSMNLTNYKKTPIARVQEMIRLEAQRYGTSIHHSEIVGLIPQDALIEAGTWYLQLHQTTSDQILERRLEKVLLEKKSS